MDMEVLLQRLHQISDAFLDQTTFNSYLSNQDGKTYYGLSTSELIELYEQQRDKLKVVNLSASTPSGRGVSISIRFMPKRGIGVGQFVIASGSTSLNEEIQEMIHGVWVPRPEPEYEPIPLLDLLQGIIEKKKQDPPPPPPPRPPAQVVTLREGFYFDKRISVYRLFDLLEEISVIFLERAPFNIRLATTQGDYYVDIRKNELIDFFSKHKRRVLTLYMDAGTQEGYLVDIKLMYRPRNAPPTAEIEVSAPEGDEIAELISEVLAVEEVPPPQKLSLFTETFRFEERRFSIDAFCSVIHAISTTYLGKVEPIAVLSTRENESYAQLRLDQLQEVFSRHKSAINVISVAINQPNTPQSFNLMLQFRTNWREPSGVLTLMIGDEVLHREVRTFVWERLKLTPTPTVAPHSARSEVEEDGRMLVNPLFSRRNFESRVDACLICMPMEAYWSDTLWEHLKTTLGTLGYQAVRADSIYGDASMESVWQAINEAELILADMTYKNPDVFYKVGIAHTLGRQVLLLTQHERDIPQDFRQFPSIVYNNDLPGLFKMAEELKEVMENFDRAAQP